MRTAEVLALYKTQTAVAKALGIAQSSVAIWGKFPPDRRQIQLEHLTGGTLKAEPDCKARLLGVDPSDTKAGVQ